MAPAATPLRGGPPVLVVLKGAGRAIEVRRDGASATVGPKGEAIASAVLKVADQVDSPAGQDVAQGGTVQGVCLMVVVPVVPVVSSSGLTSSTASSTKSCATSRSSSRKTAAKVAGPQQAAEAAGWASPEWAASPGCLRCVALRPPAAWGAVLGSAADVTVIAGRLATATGATKARGEGLLTEDARRDVQKLAPRGDLRVVRKVALIVAVPKGDPVTAVTAGVRKADRVAKETAHRIVVLPTLLPASVIARVRVIAAAAKKTRRFSGSRQMHIAPPRIAVGVPPNLIRPASAAAAPEGIRQGASNELPA